jgi:methylamine dehydrogenase heavy chain
MKTAWIGLVALLGASAMATAADLQPETITKTVLGEFQRIYVADPTLPHMPDGRVYVVDGADMKLKGMMESGFAGMMAAAPDKHRVYVATTFFERLSRGKRTDVVQVFDDRTLSVIDEIPLPDVRAQALPYRNLFMLSAGGGLLLVQNATPATSVTVVDLETKTSFETMTPGCYGIYPAIGNPLRFATLCGDGTASTYTISSDRRTATPKSGTKFFEPEKDALYTHAERDRDAYVLLSYGGKLVRVAVDGETVQPLDSAQIATGEPGWAPGGLQPFAFDVSRGIAYILMHPNAVEGSHKNPSAEIWAYDLRAKRLVGRSPAPNLVSVTLGQSGPPALFAIDGVDGKIVRYALDPETGKATKSADIKLGETAALIETPK